MSERVVETVFFVVLIVCAGLMLALAAVAWFVNDR
jgi:hypothetical protein